MSADEELKTLRQLVEGLASDMAAIRHDIAAIRIQNANDQRDVLRVTSAIDRIERHLKIPRPEPEHHGGPAY